MATIPSFILNKYLRGTLPFGTVYRLLSEGGIVLGGQLASGIAGVAAVSYFSSLLPPSEYGLLTLALLSVILCQTIFWGVGAALVRFFGTAFDNGTLKSLLAAIWTEQKKRTICLIAIAFICWLILLAFNYSSNILWITIFVFLTAAVSCYGALFDQLHTAVRNRLPVAVHQAAVAWLKILSVGCIIYLFGASASCAIAGICLAVFIVAVWQYSSYSLEKKSLIQRTKGNQSSVDWIGSVSRFSTPFVFWNLAIVAQQSADRWALHWNCSSDDLGSYSAVFGITLIPVTLLFQCASQVARPIFFRNAGNEGDLEKQVIVFQQGTQFVKLAFIGMLLITFVSYLCSDLIVSSLLNSRYWSAEPLVPLFVLTGCLAGISQIIELQIQVFAKSRVLAVVRIANSVISILVVFLTAYYFGMYGVGIATLLSQVTVVFSLFSISLIYFRRIRGEVCRQ
jgi:O-antigen/teichoic acid export membrane protein